MDPNAQERTNTETFLYLSLEECKCLFHWLKKHEFNLSDDVRFVLQRLEKTLYSRLSIREIEDL